MTKFELIATSAFGLEAVVKREIQALGYAVTDSSNGRITYAADERAIVRSNLQLRCADRVYLKMAEFEAKSFEKLFQGTLKVSWEKLIPADGKFTVEGSSMRSVLHSVPACQSIVKKAVATRLGEHYKMEMLPETGPEYNIRFMLQRDKCLLLTDSSGAGLHKRGYRARDVEAPIKETLAAALVQLSFFKEGRIMADPMCGSGTIAIEAAMLARNIAPGLSRNFASENWNLIPQDIWKEERKAAFETIREPENTKIYASDSDARAVNAARENAIEAGVDDLIEFSVKTLQKFKPKGERGIIITNPPYGIRVGERKELDSIYFALKNIFKSNPDWSIFLISADKDFERKFGRPANRRRKLYNGRIESCYYQYHGIKP